MAFAPLFFFFPFPDCITCIDFYCEALVTAVLIKTPDDPAEFMMKAAEMGRYEMTL